MVQTNLKKSNPSDKVKQLNDYCQWKALEQLYKVYWIQRKLTYTRVLPI